MRQLGSTAVSTIIHDECALRLLLLDKVCHLWISVACRRCHLGISIPHHFLDTVSRMQRMNRLYSLLSIAHVDIVVTVVAHKHDGILPVAGIGILYITDGLVDHHLGVSLRRDGETADSHITHVELLSFVSCAKIGTLTIIKIGKEAIINITVDGIEGVFTLVSQEIVVRVQALAVGCQHAVIPYAVAKEHKILRQVFLRLCPIVEHFHVSAIDVSIGRTT